MLARLAIEHGGFYLQQQDIEKAEELFKEAVEIYRSNPQPSVTYRRLALQGLGRIVDLRDDGSQEYVPTRLAFVDYVRDVVGEDDLFLPEVLGDYAGYLEDRGQLPKALELDLEALELLLRTGGKATRIALEMGAVQGLSWKIAVSPEYTPEEYEVAFRAASVYLEQRPDDFAVINTLGTLHYRLGRYEKALETLARSDAHYSQVTEGGAPHDLAFMAMSHHQLGQVEEAQTVLARLREVMSRPEVGGIKENQGLLLEAETLIGGDGE